MASAVSLHSFSRDRLDFKNLNMLNNLEIIEVNKILLKLSKKNNIYVESQSIINLFRIKKSLASSKCVDGTIWSTSPCISNVSVLFLILSFKLI